MFNIPNEHLKLKSIFGNWLRLIHFMWKKNPKFQNIYFSNCHLGHIRLNSFSQMIIDYNVLGGTTQTYLEERSFNPERPLLLHVIK